MSICPICGACGRCFQGDHGDCHGCRCGCQSRDGMVRPEDGCDHLPLTAECPDCGGDGYSDPREECPTCGHTTRRATACDRCKGNGRVTALARRTHTRPTEET